MLEGGFDFSGKFSRIFAAIGVKGGADFGGDGETGRDWQAEIGHFGEVGPLATQQVFHARFAFSLTIAE